MRLAEGEEAGCEVIGLWDFFSSCLSILTQLVMKIFWVKEQSHTHTRTHTRTQIHIHICTNAIAAEGYFVELLSIFVSLSFLSCRVYIYLEKHLYFQSNFLCFFWLFGFIISPLVACNGCLCTYIVHVHVSVCVCTYTHKRALVWESCITRRMYCWEDED